MNTFDSSFPKGTGKPTVILHFNVSCWEENGKGRPVTNAWNKFTIGNNNKKIDHIRKEKINKARSLMWAGSRGGGAGQGAPWRNPFPSLRSLPVSPRIYPLLVWRWREKRAQEYTEAQADFLPLGKKVPTFRLHWKKLSKPQGKPPLLQVTVPTKWWPGLGVHETHLLRNPVQQM